MKEIKHVAVYLRISREKGEDIDTLQSHRERLTRLCESKGWQFTLFEEVISGQAKLESREQLNEMLDRLNEFDAVVVTAIDRLSRDLEYSIHIIKRLEKAGVPLVTPDRIYTEADFMIYSLESLMGHQEYKMIRKRMLQGKRDKALRGEIVSPTPPMGYSPVVVNKRRTYEPNSEAETVKRMFELASQGYGLTELAKMFNKSLRGVQVILSNEAYTGVAKYQDIRVENAFPAIVSEDLFHAVKKAVEGRFSGNKEQRMLSRGQTRTMLKDLVFCNRCGRKMGWQTNRQGRLILKTCQHCGMGGVVERALVSQLYHELADLEIRFRQQWQKLLEGVDNTTGLEVLQQKLDTIKDKQDKQQKRLDRAKMMRLDGELSREEYTEIKANGEQQLDSLRQQEQELQRELHRMDTAKIAKDYEDKLALMGRFKELQNITHPNKKGMLPVYPTIEPPTDLAEANRILKLIIDRVYYEIDFVEGGINLLVAPKF
jgi:site-specific DNA recombinase